MPLTGFATDALGEVIICLVALLISAGVYCIIRLLYFRYQICSQGYIQLNYFNGPWIIRLAFVLLAIWWGIGEVLRLNVLRHEGWVLSSLSFTQQETLCKCYIVSNLGFAEPGLFLMLVFLLRAPLENMQSGVLSRRWNWVTAGCIALCCFPVFVLQLILALVGPQLDKLRIAGKLPHYFTSVVWRSDGSALCTYPFLSTILLGIFALILTAYLLWLGRRILRLVLNKVLERRVKAVIFTASGFLPLRVLFLGLSVLSKPERLRFEVFSFMAFLSVLSCAGLSIWVFVAWPVADSLAVGNIDDDLESQRRGRADHNERSSLISNSGRGESSRISGGRNSDASTKRGSISFRAYEKDGSSTATFVELSPFSPSPEVGTPSLTGWPLRAKTAGHGVENAQ